MKEAAQKHKKNSKWWDDLSKQQILLLKLSDDDIKKGKLIPQDVVDNNDLKWLKSL